MPQLVDCYFLVENRNPETILRFLNMFLPENRESAVEYGIPMYSDQPDFVFSDVSLLLEYLFEQKDLVYSIYWSNRIPDEPIRHGMVFHTDDGKMILGVSIIGNNPEEKHVLKYYKAIRTFLNAKTGCLTVEEAPPWNSPEFSKFAKERFQPQY